jgi:hypothetical protein
VNASKIGVGIAVLLALSIVIVLALEGEGTRSYPAGSPEAAMQVFLQDLFDDDVRRAHDRLTPALASRCTSADLRFTPASYHDVARITDVARGDSTARLTVVFTDEAGLFDEPYESVHDVGMELIDGDWLIGDLDERFDCR